MIFDQPCEKDLLRHTPGTRTSALYHSAFIGSWHEGNKIDQIGFAVLGFFHNVS